MEIVTRCTNIPPQHFTQVIIELLATFEWNRIANRLLISLHLFLASRQFIFKKHNFRYERTDLDILIMIWLWYLFAREKKGEQSWNILFDLIFSEHSWDSFYGKFLIAISRFKKWKLANINKWNPYLPIDLKKNSIYSTRLSLTRFQNVRTFFAQHNSHFHPILQPQPWPN